MLAGIGTLPAQPPAGPPPVPLHLAWRAVGPAMFAGRVADVAGIPGNA